MRLRVPRARRRRKFQYESIQGSRYKSIKEPLRSEDHCREAKEQGHNMAHVGRWWDRSVDARQQPVGVGMRSDGGKRYIVRVLTRERHMLYKSEDVAESTYVTNP